MKTKTLSLLIAAGLLASCQPAYSESVFKDGFEGNAPPPVDPCAGVTPGPPWNLRTTSWEQMYKTDVPGEWSATIPWPGERSWQHAVGSWTFRTTSKPRGLNATGLIMTAKFVMDDQNHRWGWVGAQGVYNSGYLVVRPADVIGVSFSRCKGDLRVDPPLTNPPKYCAAVAGSGNITYGPGAGIEACRFRQGETVWITLHFAGHALDPTKNTCAKPTNANPQYGVTCEVNSAQSNMPIQ